MKKIRIIPLILAMLMLASCAKQTETASETDKAYATVNGETITSSEIEYFKKRDRADIINEFSEKYNVADYSDFWEKEFEGITPSQALEERALKDAASAKIGFVLMKEQGIYEEISFEALKSRAEKYNESHKNGAIGITNIDLESFYTYYYDTGVMELKNRLAKGELRPSQEEIDEYLSEHSGITEDGAVSYIVNDKYEEFFSSLVDNAKIRILEGD